MLKSISNREYTIIYLFSDVAFLRSNLAKGNYSHRYVFSGVAFLYSNLAKSKYIKENVISGFILTCLNLTKSTYWGMYFLVLLVGVFHDKPERAPFAHKAHVKSRVQKITVF